MKIFNKKYHYILPILCLAAFSAQATDLTEQDLSAITAHADLTQQELFDILNSQEEQELSVTTGQADLTQQELFDILNLQRKQEELANDRALRNKQNEDFKEARFQDLENDSVLSDLNKKLMHNESILKDSKARSEQFPGNPTLLGTIEKCQKTIEDVQAQINLYTVSLMKDYEEDCESYGIDSILSPTVQTIENTDETSSVSVQTMENISEKASESPSEDSNESREIQKFEKFIELPEEIQLLIVTESCKQSLSEDQYSSDISFVNKKWNDWMTNEKSPLCQFLKELELKVEIFYEDFVDSKYKKIERLKDNAKVESIVLHNDFSPTDISMYCKFVLLASDNMKNKPNLKKLNLINFWVRTWLSIFDIRGDMRFEDCFNIPRMKFFLNLEELVIANDIEDERDMITFKRAISCMPKLRLLKINNKIYPLNK